MHKNNPWSLPEKTQAKVTPDYWHKKPRSREAILKEVKREEDKINRKKEKVVGYLAKDDDISWLAELGILCKACYKKRVPSTFKDHFDTITQEEYHNKELGGVYLCSCDECKKKLVEK